MNSLRRFVRGSWERVTNATPLTLGVLGVLFLVIGVGIKYSQFATTNIPGFQLPISHVGDTFILIGQAILVSGVFAAVVQSTQIMEIFKRALEDSLLTEEFLTKRSDLLAIWKRVTAAKDKRKFPKIANKLNDAVLSDYSLGEKNYYYRDYRKVVTIEWADKKKGLVRVTDNQSLVIVPFDRSAEIDYVWYWYPDIDASKSTYDVKDFTIDDADKKGDVKQSSKELPDGRRVQGHEHKVKLKDREEYRVCKQSVSVYPLIEDPALTFRASTFVDGTRVKVQCVADGLRVEFQALGTLKDFADRLGKARHPSRPYDLDMEYEDLIFPRQGYILIITHR